MAVRRPVAAHALARAPVVVRRARRGGVERTPRVPRRLRARPRRHALRVRALPAPARRPALRSARRRRQRARARRGRGGARPRRAPAARQGRRRRPAAAPSSRSSPTRSKRWSPPCTSTPDSRPARDLVLRCLAATASPRPPPGPAAATTRPASRSSRRRAALGRPRYLVRDEGPDHAKHFFATVFVGDRAATAKAKGGSKKQAEQAAAWVAWSAAARRSGRTGRR